MGYMIALFGIAACVLFCGIGSCIGLYKTGTAKNRRSSVR